MSDAAAVVSVQPGMMSGSPCIAGHRLTTEQIAGLVWTHGIEEVQHGWDYLSRPQILVACWFESRYGTRSKLRRAWKEWLAENSGLMWLGDWESVPTPPCRAPNHATGER